MDFCVKIGKTPSETLENLRTVFGVESLSKTRTFYWHQVFRQGRTTVVDLPRKPRNRTGRSQANVDAVKQAVEADRRLSVKALSARTGVPATSVFRILKIDLELMRKAAKFVPKLLNPAQQEDRFWICSNLLQNIFHKKDFMRRVITMDETWAYQYDPELKMQSTQSLGKKDSRPYKAIRARATGKVLLVSFFDYQGLVHFEFFHRTINTEIFIQILERLRISVLQKRGLHYLKTFMLHMDNAPPHTALDTRKFLIQCGTKVIEHPAYSPDLAPSDFWLYPRLKKPLRGLRFVNLRALKETVRTQLGMISSHEFEDCLLRQWPLRWARCVHNNGFYFEGLKPQ